MSYYITHVQIDTRNITRVIANCNCKTAKELYKELTNDTLKYQKWGERAFDDPNVLKFIIGKYPWTWIDLCGNAIFMSKHPNRLSDYDVALLSCQTNSSIYQHLSDEFKVDDSIIKAALMCRSYREYQGDYHYGTNSNILKQIPAELNATYAPLAVEQNGWSLKHVLVRTDAITKAAVKQEGRALCFATDEQKQNRKIRDQAFVKDMDLINQRWFLEYCSPSEIIEKQKLKKKDDIRREDQSSQHWG